MIKLTIRGFHITGFKNSKMLAHGKLLTDPKKKRQMENIIGDFESQLLFACQTIGQETSITAALQSWIASSLPANDSWQHIPEIHLRAEKVKKGEEGAVITIEEIH